MVQAINRNGGTAGLTAEIQKFEIVSIYCAWISEATSAELVALILTTEDMRMYCSLIIIFAGFPGQRGLAHHLQNGIFQAPI
ncbi:hypothetical protein DCCM_3128 [Desulfocucumis palustris]|uniref:Uncharacterized protein n=1 Tax=Desulfocucumis palustris TaxID=1898651 RepID=A0A2L2XCF3_9FIRM|nr:hypothetical protein DCCM_3128 [Desulfocucumis palustris]